MNIKFFLSMMILGGLVGLSPTLNAQETTHHKKGSADATFAKKASAGGLTEVELGKLAAQNGDSQDVKDFGAKMVTDHGKINDNLKTIADKDSLTLSDKPSDDQQALIDKLTKASGKAFDTAYIHAMVKAHIGDKAAFKAEEDSTSNADLKQFTGDSLTVIEDHLNMIEQIAAAHGLGGSKHSTAAMNMNSSDAAQSKSGAGPGSNGNLPAVGSNDSGMSPQGPSTTSPSTPATGDAAQSKSGPGPGGNAAPQAPQ